MGTSMATPRNLRHLLAEEESQFAEASGFYQAGGLDHIPDLDWLVQGMVPKGYMTLFVGAPGSGKTSLMWEWAWFLGCRGGGVAQDRQVRGWLPASDRWPGSCM